MAKQIVTLVVMPDGTAAGGKPRLSVLLTPRLEGGPTLADFPDFLHWTRHLHDHGLELEVACGAGTARVGIDRSALRPDIWEAIFSPHARVEPFRVPPHDERLLVSYPAREALAFVKYAYQAVASQPQATTREGRGVLGVVLRNLSFRDGRESNLTSTLRALRVDLWRAQQSGSALARRRPAAAAAPPDGIPTQLSQPPGTHQVAARFALFHRMEPANHRPPLPSTPGQLAKVLDFHGALTALGAHPTLLRALGLVLDLELPPHLVPGSPASPGGPYGSIAIRSVVRGPKWKVPPRFVLPATAYVRHGRSFLAAPATPAAQVAGGHPLPGDVVDGMLALDPSDFHLSQVDVDGALHKALALADNLALVSYENARNSNHPVEVEQVLPALRSAGLALMADGRALQLLESIRANRQFDEALQQGSPMPRPFTARDLVRGYRLDIWSSQSGRWHSLHRRQGTYSFGSGGGPSLPVHDEEGFTQLAVSSPAEDPTRKTDPVAKAAGAPQPGTDLFVHERVARWDGWSLSVSRPGRPINRSADPQHATDPDPTMGEPATPFKMTTAFQAVSRSLPRLRFGARYRLRARAVDLAGNSVHLDDPAPPGATSPAGAPLPYLRFEPVSHPVLMLRNDLGPGASLERLVIRTYNADQSLDHLASGEVDERHVLPPRISVRSAEEHGMLDDAQGGLAGDAATYAMIAKRDAAELPQPAPGAPPQDPRPLAQAPYLPDPLSRGAALRDLPGAPDQSTGSVQGDKLVYRQLSGTELRPGSATQLSFGNGWPERAPFRLSISEGVHPPRWDAVGRVLRIGLPKAEQAQVQLSSYLTSADLGLMGVWDWLRQWFEAVERASGPFGEGPVSPTDAFAGLTRLVLEGGHPMLTPARSLNLVHAVQQPLGRPAFSVLPVVHGAGPPSNPSALPNAFAPITAWRGLESHDAALLGGLHIHGKSTGRVDLQAYWTEFVDDPSQPGPVRQRTSAHVEKLELPTADAGVIYSDASRKRMVATYLPAGDTLWFSAPFDRLPGASPPSELAAPVHRFQDTKHRRVRYEAVATSRFREYFPAGGAATFTRASDRIAVNVPSSARPVAPDVAYVLPVFGGTQQQSTNVKTTVTAGNGLRVYLNRPWYSSGEKELLGVVTWPQAAPSPAAADREKYKPYFTQWGLDPIWQTGDLAEVPDIGAFDSAVTTAQSLALDKTDLLVDVAAHCVEYDGARRLWSCDVTFQNEGAYMPFVRLALARYQPHSLPGVELSNVVLADFAQLTPDRAATVSVDTANPALARVFVGGIAPQGPRRNVVQVTVERRMKDVISDVGWEPAPSSEVTVTEDAPGSAAADALLWSGSIRFRRAPRRGSYRVVVREFESLEIDPPVATLPAGSRFRKPAPGGHRPELAAIGGRLVYAAVLPYDFPALGSPA